MSAARPCAQWADELMRLGFLVLDDLPEKVIRDLRASVQVARDRADEWEELADRMEAGTRYLVRRFYLDEEHPDHKRVIRRGLTLAEAQTHCQDDATHEVDGDGNVVWFDGYDQERAS
jgi:hypothetical protein